MLEPIPQTPIVNAGLLYVNGIQMSANISSFPKQVTLSPGAARDFNNVNDIITLNQNTVINGALVGPNGVDAAPLIANRFYAVYVIADSTEYKKTAGLFSLSTTSPILPVGYDMLRRVGWVLTDGGANILQFWQYGTDETRSYYYDIPLTVLSGGTSTTPAVVNLAVAIPPINTEVYFQVFFTANSAADIAEFLNFGATSPFSLSGIFGYGVAAVQKGMIMLPSNLQVGNINPSILYQVTSASDSLILRVSGYKDYL